MKIRVAASVDDCRLIDIPTPGDDRGELSVIDVQRDLGYPVKRVYWLHQTQAGVHRGGHAHRALRQCYIAVAGAVTVVLDDGVEKQTVRLDRPDLGLLIGPGLWRDLIDFAPGAVLLVLASEPYDEADYIRSHEDFMAEYHGAG